MEDDLANTRAIAVVALSIANRLIAVLEDRGTLSAAEVDDLFESVLGTIENDPGRDASTPAARILVDALAAMRVARRKGR